MIGSTRGKRLREARERAGVSRAALAEQAGVRAGSIYRYETGENVPSSAVLFRMADALGVDARWLELGDELAAATGTDG